MNCPYCKEPPTPPFLPFCSQRCWDKGSLRDQAIKVVEGSEEERILLERGAKYGDATETHANLGLYWTAILQQHYGIQLEHPLPPDVVMNMLVCLKVNRAVLTTSRADDDYVDMRNYAALARDARPKEDPDGD